MPKFTEFTEEQEQFMDERASVLPWTEVRKQLNERFGTNYSYDIICSWVKRHGHKSVCGGGEFKNGHSTWSKGLSTEEMRTHFTDESWKSRQRNLSKIQYEQKNNIGDEVFRTIEGVKTPFIVVRGKSSNSYKRLQKKNRYVWEQHYGPMNKTDKIIHLDGDIMNCDISNLLCIPIRYWSMFRHNGWLDASPEIKITALEWCNLHYKLKDDN